MDIYLPASNKDCLGLFATDFDSYKIPAPSQGFKEAGDNKFCLHFTNSEEAIKYAIHLNDVYERMKTSSECFCSKEKIKQIIKAVNDQADIKSISFD